MSSFPRLADVLKPTYARTNSTVTDTISTSPYWPVLGQQLEIQGAEAMFFIPYFPLFNLAQHTKPLILTGARPPTKFSV